MQVIDIKQFITLFPWNESPDITATSSQFEAKRLRLSVAWANPLKRFEISVSLCKPKDWVYLKVTGVNEVFQTGGP